MHLRQNTTMNAVESWKPVRRGDVIPFHEQLSECKMTSSTKKGAPLRYAYPDTGLFRLFRAFRLIRNTQSATVLVERPN
jgi:hypothetical protein